MRRASTSMAVVALAAAATVGLAGPAAASPSPQANCVGQVFVPQATGDPQAIALRIAEIKGFIDVPWGEVVRELLVPLDRATCGRE